MHDILVVTMAMNECNKLYWKNNCSTCSDLFESNSLKRQSPNVEVLYVEDSPYIFMSSVILS